MNESATNSLKDQVKRAEPFKDAKACTGFLTITLRFLSAAALTLAFSSAVVLLALRLLHCFRPDFLPWTLKSAYPLILVGIAFACLQFASPRTRTQSLLSLSVALAFILWGTEQFLSNHALVSFIDDVVVFLFVLDLSIVVYGHLRPGASSVHSELPFGGPDE